MAKFWRKNIAKMLVIFLENNDVCQYLPNFAKSGKPARQ